MEDKLFFINNEHFESPYWIPGKFEENLPDDLRPYSSPAETPRASTSKLTVTGTKSGAFGANFDSESESEPSDKEEPDQQLSDSSDLVEHSVLSPLSGQGESINVDKPSTPDPFRENELPENKGEPIDIDPPKTPVLQHGMDSYIMIT